VPMVFVRLVCLISLLPLEKSLALSVQNHSLLISLEMWMLEIRLLKQPLRGLDLVVF